jgi:hypothetical protein
MTALQSSQWHLKSKEDIILTDRPFQNALLAEDSNISKERETLPAVACFIDT